MAEVYIPHQSHLGVDMIRDIDTPESGPLGTETSGFGGRQPNQDFIFPLSPSVNTPGTSHPRMTSNNDAAPPLRTVHRHKPSNLSISALPPFDFGGSSTSSLAANLIPSVSRSPVRLTTPSSHATGHRRGGSEFIGGDIAHGGPVLHSTSPTSCEDAPPAPPSPPKGPPAGRRGHAHRRSGAVSQSDIKMIMQPSNMPKADSAPSTPSDPLFQPPLPVRLDRSVSQPEPTTVANDGTRPLAQRINSAPIQSRLRVGFSDHVEYIPRPLSTISSETSSSMSTVRANHSITNSISSIVSGGTSSPSSAKGASPPQAFHADKLSEARDMVESGPCALAENKNVLVPVSHRSSISNSTSDALAKPVEHDASGGQLSELLSQVGSRDPGRPSTTPIVQTPHSDASREASTPPSGQQRPASSPTAQYARAPAATESKVTKRQHKVKSWAESILHRKGKFEQARHETTGYCRPPPPRKLPTNFEFSLENVTFDNDTTCILEDPVEHTSAPYNLQTSSSSRQPRDSRPVTDNDTTGPMIDLDAALVSPGTPKHAPIFEDHNASFSNMKRRLHSSGETGGFMGPGMHYHRRAESAPEMEAFDRARYGFPRLGSNPAMSEAIEEEEEDIDQDAKRWEQQGSELGVNVVDLDIANDEPIRRRRYLPPYQRGIQRTPTPPSIRTLAPVEIVSAEEEPRFSVITKSSDESTITPTLSQEPSAPRPASAPIDFALPTPSLTCGTTPETTSAVSSADYTRTSFDGHDIPRIHTANSSITDRTTLNSSKIGGQSAGSVDDIPSLSDSTSTMFTGRPARFSSSGNTTSSAELPASLSAAIPARTRSGSPSKRASLASLTKLMGGPYNKSKLNIAETLPPDSPQKSDKKNRHRLSRIMTFWKSRERLSAC
ncbi:MAG: hypothetical protein Q9217_002444 [Psora testacea]